MRSSQALSFIGALCVIFGLGMSTYQIVMPEAGTNSTWNVPHENIDREGQAMKRAKPGLSVLGVDPSHDRVALLDQGRIRFQGTPDEFRQSNDTLVRAFLERDVPEEDPELV